MLATAPTIPANAGTQAEPAADHRAPAGIIVIHLTPFAPRIPADAKLTDPCRWMRLGGASPQQAMRKLAERLERKPWRLAPACNLQNEIEVHDGSAMEPLAIIVDGLTLAEARAGLEALIRAARQ